MGVSKFPKLGFPRLWGPITLCENLWLRWGLKKSCSPHWELSNSMLHTTYTQGNQVNYRLLVVRSQTTQFDSWLFLGHNLCFRRPNGSYEPILNIYVSIDFQWYEFFFNPMSFDLCNRPLKIWESVGIPTPKMGVHLGVWRFILSHFFALPRAWDVTLGLPFCPATLQALILVASPRLGLQHG
jgi:hypothetical protein